MRLPVPKTLLLARIGNEGRYKFLEKIKQIVSNIVALETKENVERINWARPLLSDIITYEESENSFQTEKLSALKAVNTWREQTPLRLDGITSYDEFGVDLAAYLGGELNLISNSFEKVSKLRDKYQFRQACLDAGLPCVRFMLITCLEDVQKVLHDSSWRYPLILKPRKGTGSWYILKVNEPEELEPTWRELLERMQVEKKFPPKIRNAGFVLEEFFEGQEVDIDGWARASHMEYCLISDNNSPIEPFFLETGGTYPTLLPEEAKNALLQLTRDLLRAFPGIQSCFHIEALIKKDEFTDGPFGYSCMPIEINCRVGGAECPASFEAVTGHNLAQVSACLAVDIPVISPVYPPSHEVVCSTNLHPDEDGELLELSSVDVDIDANKVVSLHLFDSRVGDSFKLIELNGSNTSLGWISCGGDSFDEAQRNLTKTINEVKVRFKKRR